MKQRTNSHQKSANIPAQSSLRSTLTSFNPQNYLHLLKQTSVTNKTSKKITLTKPESLSSSFRATDLRPASSDKTTSIVKNSQRLGNIQSGITFTPQTKKTPFYQFPSTKGVVTRNKSEPRLQKDLIKQFQTNKQPYLSGSIQMAYSGPQSNHESMNDVSSPEPQKAVQKNNFIAGSELIAAATSSHDKHHEHGLTSSTGQTRADSQNSNQKFSAQMHLQKQPQPFTTDFLNESFELDKSLDIETKEGDLCMNHRHKRAKYYTNCEEDPLIQYKLCSKCAVALADKGAKVREIINSEEELRKSEIEAFLIKLSHSRRNTKMIFESVTSKRQDFIEFFNKQIEKTEAIRSVLEKMIKAEFDHAKKRFESQRFNIMNAFDAIESQLNGNLKEVVSMQSDIEQNLESIMKSIEIKPFQKIIGTYHQRIQELDQHLDIVRSQKINIEKLPGFKPKEIQEIKPLIQRFFELRELQTSFLKRNENEKEEEVQARKKGNCGSLCVSFENEEVFEKSRGSGIDAYRMADRFSFSGSQAEELRIFNQAVNSRTHSYGGPETETSNRTLKEVYSERSGQEVAESIQTERKAGTNHQKEEEQGNKKSPSKLRYHIEGFSKLSEQKSVSPQFEQVLSKVALDRGLEDQELVGKKSANQKSKKNLFNSLIKAGLVKQAEKREEEKGTITSHKLGVGYDSRIRDFASIFELEPSARYDNSFDLTLSKPEISERFLKKNQSAAKLETKQSKNYNSSKNLMEFESAFANSAQGQHKSAYYSPNFKENIDK